MGHRVSVHFRLVNGPWTSPQEVEWTTVVGSIHLTFTPVSTPISDCMTMFAGVGGAGTDVGFCFDTFLDFWYYMWSR